MKQKIPFVLLVILTFANGPAALSESLPCVQIVTSLLKASAPPQGGLKRRLAEIAELKIGTFNTLNLMQETESMDKFVQHQTEIADVLLERGFDIVALQEVSDAHKLAAFSETYLKDRYVVYITPGNSDRWIQIAFLVKKDLPFVTRLETHAETRAVYSVTGKEQKVFTRDLPTLSIWTDSQDSLREDPLLILNGVHLKSKRSMPDDFESTILRTTEAQAAVEILKEQREAHPLSFTMLTGDFNSDVRTAPEFRSLRALMRDAFDLKDIGAQERITHTYHPEDGPTSFSQLDTFFVNPEQVDYVTDIFVHRYRDDLGVEKKLPTSFSERKLNPSDHFPVVLKFDFRRFLQNRKLLFPAAAIHRLRPTPAANKYQTPPALAAA